MIDRQVSAALDLPPKVPATEVAERVCALAGLPPPTGPASIRLMFQIPVCVQYVFRGREPEFLDSAELAMTVMGFISAASLPEDWDQAATELGELGERYLHERLWTFVAMELAPRLARQDVVRLAGDRGH